MNGRVQGEVFSSKREFNGVDDNIAITLNYKDCVAILEGTWDMTAAPMASDEIFGLKGGLVIGRDAVDLYTRGPHGREAGGRGPLLHTALPVPPSPPEMSGALAYMVDRTEKNLPIEGMRSLDVNVQVVAVLNAGRRASKEGRAAGLE